MHFETRTGVGRLWTGNTLRLSNIPYRIDISRSGGGLWRVEGQIEASFNELTSLVLQNPSDLELELSDGTRWGCVLQNNSGRLLNSGRHNLPVPA